MAKGGFDQMGILELEASLYAHGLIWADILALLVIMVGWPIYAYVSFKLHPIEKIRQDPNLRLKSYNESLSSIR